MPRMINYRELKEQYDADAGNCARELSEALEQGQLKPDEFSIRELAEAFLGEHVVRSMERRKSGGRSLMEAASAVDTSAFSNITGQILFTKIKEQFGLATMLADQLCTTDQTTFLNGEKIPGIGNIGDEAEVVDEGQPYPTVGLNEEYVETPRLTKRGFTLPVTREVIVADRTGVLMQQAGKGSAALGLNKEKRVLDTVFGVTNSYKRNGTSSNTYLAAGAYINTVASNALVDWTDVENVELLFDAMTDPNTGEPIGWNYQGMTLVVPTALRRTALRVVQATDIRFGDGASNTTATYGKNPLSGDGIQVLSSPYVKGRTGSASTWFYGRFKEAFGYREAWAITPTQAPAGHPGQFDRDIEIQFKVSEMGTACVYEPRYVCKSTA